MALSELTNHRKSFNCDWPIRLLFTSYCLTFLYVPWALWFTLYISMNT